MPRRRRHRSTKRIRRRKIRRTRRQRGGTLAFLEDPDKRAPILAVGIKPNEEGEYDNPDNVPTLRLANL